MNMFGRWDWLHIVWVVTAMAASFPLHAQECDAHLFPGDMAQVKQASVSVAKAWFYGSEPPDCPTAGERCRKTAYVVQGNVVLTGQQVGTFVCAAFLNGRRQTTGWLKAEALHSAPWSVATEDWAGTWVRMDGKSTIHVRTSKDGLYADAVATYAVSAENVRTGAARGPIKITEAGGEKIATFFNDGDAQCRVTLRRSGALLLVDDGVREDTNSPCGGMGVTLSGIYRKRGAR
jgi:hypothetical protein